MKYSTVFLTFFATHSLVLAAPGWTTSIVSRWTTTDIWHGPSPTPGWPHHGDDCGEDCGGVCGDKIVQHPQEECDLGPALNGAPKSGCSATCKFTHWCGDGHVDPGEACDLGAKNGVWGSGCSANCTCVGYCGDGFKDPWEGCDLGPLNGKKNSGCSAKCEIEPVCGNGVKEAGEECDAGSLNGAYNSGCNKECKLCGYCGDGLLDDAAGEECDLGYLLNGAPGSNCSATCTKELCTYKCGNGVTEPGEECDDGPKNGPSGRCSKECKWNTCSCGNGITEYPEECDDGPLTGTPGSKCDKNCKWIERCGNPVVPKCGDGEVTWPEECDAGYLNGHSSSNCTTFCTWAPPTKPLKCGDGIITPPEECDNGPSNGLPGSTCSSLCKLTTRPPTPPTDKTCPQVCNPNPLVNKCHITTSCITTPTGLGVDYCACRAGYRADGLKADDDRQFRMKWTGQEYRVLVAPGVSCDTLCTTPHPGPESCQEVPVKDC